MAAALSALQDRYGVVQQAREHEYCAIFDRLYRALYLREQRCRRQRSSSSLCVWCGFVLDVRIPHPQHTSYSCSSSYFSSTIFVCVQMHKRSMRSSGYKHGC